MNISFYKLSPGGNDTLLVESAIHPKKQANIANRLMIQIPAEQVGYIKPISSHIADAQLVMMGGELCINALRCAAALLGFQKKKEHLQIASSGTKAIFKCRVQKKKEFTFKTTINFEVAYKLKIMSPTISIVHLEGISHILVKAKNQPQLKTAMKNFMRFKKLYKNELKGLSAFGVITYAKVNSDYVIEPIVYVKQTKTTIRETGCGSGSIALALLKRSFRTQKMRIRQPSKALYTISIQDKTNTTNVAISSDVEILLKGNAFFNPIT